MKMLKSMPVVLGLMLGGGAVVASDDENSGVAPEPTHEMIEVGGDNGKINLMSHVRCKNIETGDITILHAENCDELNPQPDEDSDA